MQAYQRILITFTSSLAIEVLDHHPLWRSFIDIPIIIPALDATQK